MEKSGKQRSTAAKPEKVEPIIEVIRTPKGKSVTSAATKYARTPKTPWMSGMKIRGALTKLVAADDIASNSQLDNLVRDGLPIDLVDRASELIQLMTSTGVLPRKTIEDSKKNKSGKLSSGVSERVIRIVRMVQQAKDALGEGQAIKWLQKPNKNFGGLSALEMGKTESGARAVEQFLLKLSHGFAA